MCAGSDAKIEGNEVGLYMGFYGSSLTIDNHTFNQKNVAERAEMYHFLLKFSKEDIITMLLDLIDNSNE